RFSSCYHANLHRSGWADPGGRSVNGNGRADLQGCAAQEAWRNSRRRRHQAAAGLHGEQHSPGRHGGSGQRQQRSPHPAETQANRREDSAGDRRSALAHRQGHLRRLPRLRRADCPSAAERDSVDARLHQLQRKTELVSDLLALLLEFHRDKLAMVLRHEAGARLVKQYDVNNTYQYIINREEAQLSWLSTAIVELGGTVNEAVDAPRLIAGKDGKGADAAHPVIEGDARGAQ